MSANLAAKDPLSKQPPPVAGRWPAPEFGRTDLTLWPGLAPLSARPVPDMVGDHLHPAEVGHLPKVPPHDLLRSVVEEPIPVHRLGHAVVGRLTLAGRNFDPRCSHSDYSSKGTMRTHFLNLSLIGLRIYE